MKTLQAMIIVILLACTSAPAAPAQSATTSMDFFRKGSGFYLKGDYRNADVYLQQALDLEKQKASLPRDYWRALVDNLATSYRISGDLKPAREVLEYGISQDPTYPSFHYTLACTYAEADDLDRALEEFSIALKYKANVIPGERMPDPRKDKSFDRFQNDKRFQTLMASVHPGEITIYWPPAAGSSTQQSNSQRNSELPSTSQDQFANSVPTGQPQSAQPKLPQGRRIRFIPLAEFPTGEVQELAAYYRGKFNLEIEILPSSPIPESAIDNGRQQLVAERLVAGLRHSQPALARDSDSILIAFTNRDIYTLSQNWRFAFGWRDRRTRAAVVSTARMDLHYPGEPPTEARPEVRLRKMVTKDIGILYYELPQNNNPRSVLYERILGIQELDTVSEDF
jgi:predicted Zn-dependent protease